MALVKHKMFVLSLSFVLLFTLLGCTSRFEESYSFSDPIEMPEPKPDGRGGEIEHLHTQYGESYVEDSYLENAVIAARQWRWSDAYNELNNKAKENPNYLDVYRLQAELYLVNSEYEEAVSQLDQLLRQHPDDAHALSLAVLADVALGNEENAQARWQDLQDINIRYAEDIEHVFELVDKWVEADFRSLTDSTIELDLIAVFGEAPRVDFTLSQSTLNKVIKAKELLAEYPEAKILVSGDPVDQPISEAEVMKDWLVSNDVPEDQIIMDELARDTVGNAIGIVDYMIEHQLETVIGLSGYDHLIRGLVSIDAYSQLREYPITIEGLGTGKYQERKTEMATSPYTYYNAFKSYGLIEKEYYHKDVYENR